MGCISSKPSVIDDGGKVPWERESSKEFSEYGHHAFLKALRRKNSLVSPGSESGRVSLADRSRGSMRMLPDGQSQKFPVKADVILLPHPVGGLIPRAREAEQAAAGWPSWLVDAAGEAIKGWIPRHADDFQKLDKIGEGTYSSVYKARDLLHDKIVALKRVRFDNLDIKSIKFMAREILILRRLNHPNIIKLEGLIVSPTTGSLYLIFEYMEHDLMGLASLPGLKFTEPQVKCYMKQLLDGLDHCHSNGVLHRDVKGANLLIDNNGILKIADFGLATSIHHSQPLTSRVVTLWYRPPELLLGAKHYGPAVDLWSAGCILAELCTGKPTLPGRTEIEQLHRIFKLCGSPSEDFWVKMKLPHSEPFRKQPHKRCIREKLKDIPGAALGLIETLLSIDPDSRGTAASALKSEFFTTEPPACDPASLPRYPPSKEMDARMREELEMRRDSKETRGKLPYPGRQRMKISAPTLPRKHPAELLMPTQGQREMLYPHTNHLASAHGLNPPEDENAEAANDAHQGFSGPLHRIGVYSGPLTMGAGWQKTGEKPISHSLAANGSRMENLSCAAATRPPLAHGDLGHSHKVSAEKLSSRLRGSMGGLENPTYQEWLHHSHTMLGSHQIKETAWIKESAQPRYEQLYMSGPLLVSSRDTDRMLRQHDRRLQEDTRRPRPGKSWHRKVHYQESSSRATQLLHLNLNRR